MEVLIKQIAKHPTWVFTYKGKPVVQVNTKAWRGALKRAGIDNFRCAAYLGELADAMGRAAECDTGNGRMGIARDGAALCASGPGAVRGPCPNGR